MNTLNKLIPGIENIVGSYTDEKSYTNLMQINPYMHTQDKLLLKKIKKIPSHDLDNYLKAYELATEWCKKYKKEIVIVGIDTIAGIMKSLMDIYEFNRLEDLDNLKIYNSQINYNSITLHEYIKYSNYTLCNGIENDIDYEGIIDFLNDKLKDKCNYILQAYGIDDIRTILLNAINDLNKNSDNIFFNTCYENHIKELELYIEMRVKKFMISMRDNTYGDIEI